MLEQWHKPFVTCYSDGDPITRGLDGEFVRRVPGAKGQPHCTLSGGHFMQEDDSARFARLIVDCCRTQNQGAGEPANPPEESSEFARLLLKRAWCAADYPTERAAETRRVTEAQLQRNL